MKITKQQLTKIIKEELDATVSEGGMPKKEGKLKLLRTALAKLAQGAKEDKLGSEVVAILDNARREINDLIEQPGAGYHYV